VHLFGIPVQIERLRAVADEVGAFLMEDSAQWDERNELGMVADAMIRSFGRGKPRSTLGGGMLIAKREDIATAIARMQASSGAQSNGGLCEVLGFLASDLFIRPGLYWMPAQCPFLGLGKTIYPNDIPVGRMTRFRLELLAILEARDAALARTRARNARCYAARLQETSGHAQIAGTESAGYAPARFPFYVSSSVADAGARRLREASHLGIVRMYPHGLQELEQIQQVFVNKGMDFSGAEWIAGHLLTAPTHQWVDDRMRSRISDFIASHAA
jgi:dTDP-4-amino-4,6-dideoxygalactose transaminase